MRVLVVEDEIDLLKVLARALREAGYAVDEAADGDDALAKAVTWEYDAVVLDLMLPELDGSEVLRRLRRKKKTPVLILSARDTVQDRVGGLDLGADDYLTKPFSFEILLARIRAVGRRGPIAHPVILRVQDLTIDETTRTVARGTRRIQLTRTEYALLLLLARNADRVVTRDTLIEKVWGHTAEIESNTLDAFMRLLRNKLEGLRESKLLQTVRGVGYCLRSGRN